MCLRGGPSVGLHISVVEKNKGWEAEPRVRGHDSSSADDDDDTDDSTRDDAVSGGSGAGGPGGKAADDNESGAGEEADDEESSSGDTEDETEGEASVGDGPEPVAGKNAAATTSEPREAGGTGGKIMALGAGALLLAAGVYVARRTSWS